MLQLGSNYLNQYEAAHSLLEGNSFFRQDDWETFAKRGELDQYIGVLSESDKLPSFDDMNNEYRFDLYDADHRFTAMANELQGDRTNVDTERTETYYDENGIEQTRKFNMSDYDYTKYLLKQYTDYQVAQENKRIEQQRKDDMNGFVKFLADIGGIGSSAILGASDMVNNLLNLVEGVGDGAQSLIEGGTFEQGWNNAWRNPDFRIFDNIGLTNVLLEYERKYTDLRDVDGNYTTLGKYLGGVSYSLGQMLPSIGFNAIGKLANAGTNIGKIGGAIYYVGLTAGNISEMSNNPELASIPTSTLVLNAAIKSGIEYLVQLQVSKFFGSSVIDRFVFGQSYSGVIGKSTGITLTSALGNLLKSGVNEGVEEMLQQYSNVLVDQFFSLADQNFGQLTDWNLQTMADAFVLGAIGGFAASGIEIAFTSKQNVNGTKLGKLQSWQYINTLSDIAQQYDNIKNNKKLTSEQLSIATGQLYESVRIIGSLYNEIGADRMRAANNMLTMIQRAAKTSVNADAQIRRAAEYIYNSIPQMQYDSQVQIANLMKVNQMTEVNDIINRDNIDTIDDAGLLEKTKKYFEDNPDTDYIIYTKDGKNIIGFKNAKFIPIEYINNVDSNSILKNEAEQAAVQGILNSSVLKSTIEQIADTFKKVTGRDATNEEVVYNLLFNDSFQRILLMTANRDVYRILAQLDKLEKAVTRKTVKDAIYKERISKLKEQLSNLLVDYLINQQTAQYKMLSILTNEQKKYIAQQRYSKDLANRVRSNEKLSTQDYSVLENRVNSMPATDEVRQEVINNLHSDNTTARNNAMNVIEQYYRNVFNSPYDNKTYLRLDNQGNVTFNEFMRSINKTLRNLLTIEQDSAEYQIIAEIYGSVTRQTIIRYYRDQFKEFSGDNFDFVISKGQLFVHETTDVTQQGFKNFIEQHKAIRGNYNNIENLTFVNIRQDAASKILNNIISKDIDSVSRAALTVRDLVFNQDYLNKTIQKSIEDTYGSITPINTFLYLRKKFLDDSGNTTSIVVTPEYDFVIVDVRPMTQMFKDQEFKIQKDKEVNISNYIKDEYLIGRLIDTKVRIGKEDTYNPTSNIITISDNKTPAEARFAIAHEFQHAIQVENDLNGGLDYNWLNNMTKRNQRSIINDIRRHRPELFEYIVNGKTQKVPRNSELEFEIARNFIYDSTGEAQAYGAEGRDIIDYYPVIVTHRGSQIVLVTPWGSEYVVNSGVSMALSNMTKYVKNAYLKITNDVKNISNDILSSSNRYTNILLPDGTELSIDAETHNEWRDYVFDKLKELGYNDDTIYDFYETIVDIGNNEKFDEDTSYYIILRNNLTNEQKYKLSDIIDEIIKSGKDVIMANEYSRYSVNSDDFKSGIDMINNYISHQSLDNMSMASSSYDPVINDYAKRTYNTEMTPNSLTGFIFPDGTVGFSETMWTHEQFYQDLAQKFGSRADSFKDNLVEIALNTNRFKGAYVDSMTVRINGRLNADQRTALYDFVSDVLANNSQIEIEDVRTGRYAGSQPGDYNARRLLARVGVGVGGAMSMAQPGDKRTRRVKADIWKTTNLKYFPKRKQIAPEIQDLIINTDGAQLEPDLWDLIGGSRKGELNMWTLQEYIRNASEMNDYTFEKINQYVYQNPNLKTFKQLQRLADNFDMYFSLSVAIRSIKGADKTDLLNRKISYKNARKLYDQVATDPRTSKAVNKAIGYFNGYIDTRGTKPRYVPLDLDLEAARISLLKHYDGTINSVVGVAMRSKAMAILYKEHPYYRQRSGRGGEVSADEQLNESQTRLDFISDDSAQDAFNEILSGYTREQLVDAIFKYTLEQAEIKGITIKNEDALRAQIELRSTETLETMFTELDLASDAGVEVNDNMIAFTPDEQTQQTIEKNVMKYNILKRPSSYKQSIAQFAKTVRNRLSLLEFKKLPDEIRSMFDKNGMLIKSAYENKSRQELAELRNLFAQIAEKAKRGEFTIKSDELLRKEIRDIKRENRQLAKELANRPIIERAVNISNHEFTINSDAEMPTVLKEMFDTSFETFANTDVKYLTGSDEKHLKLSLNEFADKNAMRLASLTSGDAEAIVDYFNHAVVISDEQSLRLFSAIKMYSLEAIYRLAQDGQFVLSAECLTRIRDLVKAAGTQAGTDLAVFANVIETFNPAKRIIQSMARSNGIEFDEIMVDDMIDALKKNDIAKVRVIKEQMYNDILAKAKRGKVRRTIWDKLISFERMAMLSSPGTWVRNIASNVVVSVANDIGSKIGKLFTKKFKKDMQGQYQLTNTKTSDAVYKFIKDEVEDSGLFALIKEGLNKWDPRGLSQKSKTADQLTRMIMSTVENEVFSHSFNQNKGIKNTGYLLETFMSKVLSDNYWIDKRFKSYLGKMLTEDIENKTVLGQKPTKENGLKPIDLSHGLTPEIMNIIADAYKLAAYDYMHRFNTFSKIDATIRERGGNAVYFLWKQIMPFAAASWNWFMEGLSYTPIGLGKAIVDFARMENTIMKLDEQRRKGNDVISSSFVRYITERNIGKGAIGTVGFAIGMALGGFGVAEVDEEDDKVKLHIGDIWIDITSITGTQGILLGMMIMNPSKGDAWDAMVQVADTLVNDSTLDSLFNLFRYSNSAGEFVLSYPMTIAGMFVPNALKAFNSLIQPNEIKYSSGFLGDLEYFAQSLIPGFSYALMTHVDPFTGEVQTKYNIPFIFDFINRMSPIKIYQYRVSELEKQVRELSSHLDEPLTTNELTGRYDDIGQLTSEQIVLLNQKYGELNNEALIKFFNNQTTHRVQNEDGTYSELKYNQMTDEQRANAYRSITSKNATYAKIYVWTQSGNRYYATDSMFEVLRQLNIRQNVYREVGKKSGFVS